MKKISLLVICLAFIFPHAASANIVSNFDFNDEGWTNPVALPAAVAYQATGGNSGGFLLTDDTIGTPGDTNVFMAIFAPGKFTGDLSAYTGGTISFDALLILALFNFPLEEFGVITISGAGDSAQLDLAPGSSIPAAQWTSYSAPLTAAAWGKTQLDWLSILGDVTEIRLDIEPIGGPHEIVGIDNFAILAVPGPATLPLMGAGLAIVGLLSLRVKKGPACASAPFRVKWRQFG